MRREISRASPAPEGAGAVIGWDVGGAHLKAARIERGQVADVLQLPTPLWRDLDSLVSGLREARARLGLASLHVATMTGELADVFADRAEGVTQIAETLARALPAQLLLYAGRAGWIAPAEAAHHVADIASANWHASAALAARHVPDALFADMGSTTTDLVPLRDGAVVAAGYTDAERLAAGELVYTGLTRSFLMSVADRAPIDGGWTPLACEHFATSADLHRILGTLPDDVDQMPTADGRDKTTAASRARLARMVGRDAASLHDASWSALAQFFAEAQLRRIDDGARLVLSRAALPPNAPLIAAGIGAAFLDHLAHRLHRPMLRFHDLLGAGTSAGIDQCAPAVAVALLAQERA